MYVPFWVEKQVRSPMPRSALLTLLLRASIGVSVATMRCFFLGHSDHTANEIRNHLGNMMKLTLTFLTFGVGILAETLRAAGLSDWRTA